MPKAMRAGGIQPVESFHSPVRDSSPLGPSQPAAVIAETDPKAPAVMTHHW